MLKRFLLLCVCFVCISNLSANTRLKWNAAYWLFGVTNMSVETALCGERWTFNMDVVFSPWQSVDGNALKVWQFIPEVRYYPKGAFNGFYAGAYAAWHDFRFTKWNYLNSGRYQVGNGYSVGAVIGYQTPISDRWSLDVCAGGGYQNSGYRGYENKTHEMYASWNGSGEWIPYKLGISFARRLGKN